MFGMVRKIKREVHDRTVYMEIYGDNKISYRVIAGRIFKDGVDQVTYGIEVEDFRSGVREAIADFSNNIEDAVDFAETLISDRIHPSQIYSRALGYLLISI